MLKKAIGEGGFEITDITKSGQKISSLKDKSTIVDSINSNPLPSQSQKENLIQNGEVYIIKFNAVEKVDDLQSKISIGCTKAINIFSDGNFYIVPQQQLIFEDKEISGVELSSKKYEVLLNWYALGYGDDDMNFDTVYPANKEIKLVWGSYINNINNPEYAASLKYYYTFAIDFQKTA